MNPKVLYLYKLVSYFLPDTSFFAFKRFFLKWAGVKLGRNVRICSSCRIMGNGSLVIGNDVWIGHQTLIVCNKEIFIEDNVDVGPKVFLGDGTHRLGVDRRAGEGESLTIVIGKGSWLCFGSSVLPGVTIFPMTVVAAGAVVTKSFRPNVILGGVPAVVVKDILL